MSTLEWGFRAGTHRFHVREYEDDYLDFKGT